MSSDLKTKATDASVEAFIDGIEDDVQRADCERLIELMQRATGAPPRLWGPSIVGFGSYHYRYASGREGDWMLTGFSPRKGKLSIYIMAGFGGQEALLSRLGNPKTGKSCLYVKRLSEVDLTALESLVSGSVAQLRQTYHCT